MSLTSTILFDTPQSEIAPLLANELRSSVATSIVTGFATVEGVRAIETPILANPGSVKTLVVGAATFQAFDALDRLLAAGVQPSNLLVHLGHSRLTGPSARHRFYRYHPMLHSKVYYMEHADGTASAVIGSHNITGFALNGLNGEAAVLLKGPKESPEFQKVRDHVRTAREQAVVYNPEMKEALAWWAHQFFEGLSDKANDFPREGEAAKTIVILAQLDATEKPPKKNDFIYFELPSALGTIQSLKAEVHIYLFYQLPATPWDALRSLKSAHSSVWCIARGLELERGGVELRADWRVTDHVRPVLERVRPPFRPRPAADMQQVRVKAYNQVRGEFEYLFKTPPTGWVPILESDDVLKASAHLTGFETDYRSPNPEHLEWFRVVGLTKDEDAAPEANKYSQAMMKLSPDQGSYVLMSMRRREIEEREDEDLSE